MEITGKHFGVWGFGVVGKSVAAFLHQRGARVSIIEKRALNAQETVWCADRFIEYFDEEKLATLWHACDYLVPSPGIDLRPFTAYTDKIVPELDLFHLFFKKPIIAITGTVGKTSTTHFIATTLAANGARVATGGNIGIGMLDLVNQADTIDYAVLEVSSFQLEYCRFFEPAIAVITNVYPNHLDRHGTFDCYLAAKMRIFGSGSVQQKAVLNANLSTHPAVQSWLKSYQGQVIFFGTEIPSSTTSRHISIENDLIVYGDKNSARPLMHTSALPAHSFPDNWLALIAVFEHLQLPIENLHAIDYRSPFLQHRLQKIETRQAVTFYDDSKATVPESTLAAVNFFETQPIILLLGGLSKGVNRALLIARLPQSIKKVVCFGAEAEQLSSWCAQRDLPSVSFDSLEEALKHCAMIADSRTPVLFSPAGSSFDLFTDYRHRGRRFKELVAQYYEVI